MAVGALGLVGSGEYLLDMLEIEQLLLDFAVQQGRPRRFVQLATAAGQESEARLQYWRDLGEAQARRLHAESVWVPVFNRQQAEHAALADLVRDAGLIYLSGGDPSYLADTLVSSAVGDAILTEWQAGASLAGCSAGAMALGPTVPHVRQLQRKRTPGLNVVPTIHVLPHYDKFFSWMPDRVQHFLAGAEAGVATVGIDERTALVRLTDDWEVHGVGKVHCLSEEPIRLLTAGQRY